MIGTEDKAKAHAKKHLGADTLVVGEHGDIHANCNVDEVCKAHEEAGEKFFILKGERSEIKKPKSNKDKSDKTE